MRWIPYVYVRARCGTRNRRAEGGEGNPVASHKRHQRLTFRAIWIHRHVHRVAVIQAPAIMHVRLPERADGQLPAETL